MAIVTRWRYKPAPSGRTFPTLWDERFDFGMEAVQVDESEPFRHVTYDELDPDSVFETAAEEFAARNAECAAYAAEDTALGDPFEGLLLKCRTSSGIQTG